ncbi:MAG: hypothetical protein AB7E74_03515 [Pirellulales bacterium]
MIVVSDTSPLRYLILIGAVDVLPQLVGEVLIPPAVVAELIHPQSPREASDWVNNPPPWVQFKVPRNVRAIASHFDGKV